MDHTSKDEHWLAFVTKDKEFERLDLNIQNNLRQMSYRQAQSLLKQTLDDNTFKKLNGRFRAQLHRAKVGKSTLTVDGYLLRKLDAMKNNIGADDYSDLLEYLLKPDGAYKKELDTFHTNNQQHRLNTQNIESDFSHLLKQLYPEHQSLIKKVLELTFMQGALSAKTSGRLQDLEQACEEHIDKFQYNIVNL
ncbi:hypothetical protein DS2_15439 [Catenovulum agarivorans DS-2]|uniref:Uncharacterized protein n=1 Tax=Catenovulum agarivorans DS-2 TaxID=1328313 RepID=W7QTV3_9ALTE|nr:hypothetical protein [Catenovulum agarivorans]EWH08865.1 hypothetical protein DS2_15439 [Catenovulum agarivorans DS-2]